MWRTHRGYSAVLPPPLPKPTPKKVDVRQVWFNAMLNRTPMKVGHLYGLVNGIKMEDGSGQSFIITMSVDGTTYQLYIRSDK